MSGACATSAAALAHGAGSGDVAQALAVARLLHLAAQHGGELDLGALLADLRHAVVRRALVGLLDERLAAAMGVPGAGPVLLAKAGAVGFSDVRRELLFHVEQLAAEMAPPSPEPFMRPVPACPSVVAQLSNGLTDSAAGLGPGLGLGLAGAAARPGGVSLHGAGPRQPFAVRLP